MCGRYTLKVNASDLARQLGVEAPASLEPRYNIAPTQAAPIITVAAPKTLTVARWGLLPPWARDTRLASKLINARAETLTKRGIFKPHLTTHRCLVPCDGFYEWSHHGRQRTPHYIHPREPHVLVMAGLYSPWTSPEGLEVVTFTIITTRANELVQPLHDRMPVFLDDAGRARWLSDTTKDLSVLTELLVPWHAKDLVEYTVGPHVNQVAADDPSCLEPARVVQLQLL